MSDLPQKIAVVSNIIFEPHFVLMAKRYFGNDVIVYPIPYCEYTDVEYQYQLTESDMIVLWLDFECLFPNFYNAFFSQTKNAKMVIEEVNGLFKRVYSDLAITTNAHIVWFSFEDYFIKLPTVLGYNYNALIDKINVDLSDILKDKVNFIDLKRIIAEVGITNAYDPKGKYRWNAPYSKEMIEAAVKEVHKQYLIEKGLTKKCLVLDCDNVLWGGILSEDGVENLKLGSSGFGRAYQDFQRFVLSLYYHGVILAICSKNDISDVMMIFHEHGEMILKEEHIACFQVNWGNKPDNIKRIAETLNIGLDSMVFVDDSPIEIESVKAMLPEVTTILYDRDTMYEQFSCFNLKSNTSVADIEKRNETYRTNQSREALKTQYDSYTDYINALEVKIDIHEAAPIEFGRISELTQRTNKCTNGIRYTVAEIKERADLEDVTLYSFSVSDRFSDLGLVGVIEIENDTLTLFSLSCRALGREIEIKMLDFVAGKHEITKIDFKSTGKNEDIKAVLLNTFPFCDFHREE
ncbi:MAG: HAD-IIIC family phosphatase [Bacteroidales bacterium]|nr:HAD-IIIC family phosphatase [Bacteroidales bacterium]